MKKILFIFSIFLAGWAQAQPGPVEPISKTISTASNSCGSSVLNVNSSWPYAECCCGYTLTTHNVYTVFYLERSPNGTTGWTQVATKSQQTNNTATSFTVSTPGYYRCRLKMTLAAGGGAPNCWNGTYIWEYLYTNIINLSTVWKQPVVAFNINGNTAASPTTIQTYHCTGSSITLNNASTGDITAYRLNVIRANSNGSVYGGAGAWELNPGGTWTAGTIPSVIDIKAACATQFTSVPGYYLVKLEAKNDTCITVGAKTALIQVSGAPSVVTKFRFIGLNGSGYITPSTNCAAPSAIGGFTAAINGDDTEGEWITYYRLTLQEVNTSNCATVLSTIYQDAVNVPISGLSELSALSFNTRTGLWFYNNAPTAGFENRKFKVILRVGNDCGYNEKFAYFKINYADRVKSGIWNGNVDELPEKTATDVAERLTVYPNPAVGMLTFALQTADEGNVRLAIYNLNGQKVWEYSGGQSKGLSEIKADLSALPAAVYQYRVKTTQQVHTGKIVKQ